MQTNLKLVAALVCAAGAAEALQCVGSTQNSAELSWAPVADSDLYMLRIRRGGSPTDNAFAVQTTTNTSAVVIDLLPGKAYYFDVISHDSAAPSIVWGWRNRTRDIVRCATAPAAPNTRGVLRRVSGAAPTRIDVGWSVGAGCRAVAQRLGAAGFELAPGDLRKARGALIRALAGDKEAGPVVVSMVGVADAVAGGFRSTLEGLHPTSTYAAALLCGSKGSSDLSPITILRTASEGVLYTDMYRVSEYTYEVDLLRNHNSADFGGQAGFLTSTNDNDFFKLRFAPVTRYCVEHFAAPPNMSGRVPGFAPYVSCNGPEAEPRNRPEDPLCICDVYADRLIALQPASTMSAECNETTWGVNGTHDDPACFCGANHSKWATSDSSKRYVGAMPVYSPYFYYQLPRPEYPGARFLGYNFATPRQSKCGEDSELGDNSCTWKRRRDARIVFGSDLIALGWNATIVEHWPLHEFGPNSTVQLETNLPIFKKAWENLAQWVSPRCCGC